MRSVDNYVEIIPKFTDGILGTWRWSKSKIMSSLSELKVRLVNGLDGERYDVFQKDYLTDDKKRKAKSLWLEKEINYDRSKDDLRIVGLNKVFDYSKPTYLINRLSLISTNKNDIILDFFAGSGTTGAAVTELNQKDGGNRKYILVQLPEQTAEKSEAYKAGYKKISDITIERNKRVIEKIKNEEKPNLFSQENSENKDNSKNYGLGFKVFKLQKSNFPRVEFAPDPEKTEEENIELLKKYIKDKEAQLFSLFNKDELITEILIKNGFKLNYTLTKQEEFKENEILFATDGDKETLICLDEEIKNKTVNYFKTNTEQKLIVLERALDTTKKWNLKHYMGDKFNTF